MKYGGENEIPACIVKCRADDFENAIRKIGVEFACEWFGCDKEFTIETIKTLCERSGVLTDDEDYECPNCSEIKEDCVCLEPVLNKLDYEGKL